MKSLYEQIGGEEGLKKAVESFYEQVLDDPLLQLHFENVDLPRKKESFTRFIAALLGGPASKLGRSMYEAHKGKQITDLGFESFVNLFLAALRDLKVDEDVVQQINSKLAPFQNEVVDSFQWPGRHYYARE